MLGKHHLELRHPSLSERDREAPVVLAPLVLLEEPRDRTPIAKRSGRLHRGEDNAARSGALHARTRQQSEHLLVPLRRHAEPHQRRVAAGRHRHCVALNDFE